MAKITELNLNNVRCFDGIQSARLGRITLLVGENGTGKSTFLGCYHALSHLAGFHNLNDTMNYFDVAPFNMGVFNTIARRGKSDFTIGGKFEDHRHTSTEFTFGGDSNSQPIEKKITIDFIGMENLNRNFSIFSNLEERSTTFVGPKFKFQLDSAELSYISISSWLSRYVAHGHLPFRGELDDFKKRRGQNISELECSEFTKFSNFLRSELPLPNQPSFVVNAIDPELTTRQRVYESLPPYLESKRDSNQESYFAEFGKKLNLWQGVSIKPGPYGFGSQVMIETSGNAFNLVDVGYGIHSLLPLAQILSPKETNPVYLLQQPEIHVHPSAQAQLAQLMVESNCEFIIETHSMHFLDRFRICVMNGLLQPSELTIVYFEKNDDDSTSQIHNLSVDKQANLLNVPNSYSKFFMDETNKFMGLA